MQREVAEEWRYATNLEPRRVICGRPRR